MLVLTRKVRESIVMTLPDDTKIKVRLMSTDRGRARIAIDAPAHVRISREDNNQNENQVSQVRRQREKRGR